MLVQGDHWILLGPNSVVQRGKVALTAAQMAALTGATPPRQTVIQGPQQPQATVIRQQIVGQESTVHQAQTYVSGAPAPLLQGMASQPLQSLGLPTMQSPGTSIANSQPTPLILGGNLANIVGTAGSKFARQGTKRPGEGEGAGGPGEDKRKFKKRKPAEVEVVDQQSGGEDAQGVAEVDGVNPEDVGIVEQQGGGEMVKGGKGLNLTSDDAEEVAEEMSEGEADEVVAHVAKEGETFDIKHAFYAVF